MAIEAVTMVDQILKAAGIPIVGVDPNGDSVTPQFAAGATLQQRIQAAAIIQALDLTPQGRGQYEVAQARVRAKDAIGQGPDAGSRAEWAAIRVVYSQILEQRIAYNALVAWATARGFTGLPLVNKTWAEIVTLVQQLIDSEP